MSIHLDIQTQFDNRSVRNSANDLQQYLKRSGDSAGKAYADGLTRSTPKVERAMDKLANATSKVRVEQEKYNRVAKDDDPVKRVVAYERLSKAQREQAASLRAVSREVKNANEAAAEARSGLLQMGQTIGALGRVVGPIGMAVGGAGLAGAIVELAGVAASASQSLWLLPGAIGAIGTAVGAVKLATLGLDDAFKNLSDPQKFAESLRSLAPAAQQAMLSIQQMMPTLKGLQQATQNALFQGVGQQLNQLANQYLPTIQQATTGVASAFNQMFSGVANQLMTPQTQQAIQSFLANVTAAFQALAPAAAPLTQALADIMAVGSGALPDLAAAATDAASSFALFISEARASGDLQRWLNEGLDTLGQLTSIAWELGKAFMALAPLGRDVLPTITDLLSDISDIMPAITVAALAVGPAFGVWVVAIDNAARAFEGIKTVVQSVGNAVIPIINGIGRALDTALIPVRAAIKVANTFGAGIPELPSIGLIPQLGTDFTPTQGGLPGAQAQRRGGKPMSPLETAGLSPFVGGSSGIAPGWGIPGPKGQGWNPNAQYQTYLDGIGAGGAGAKTPEGLVPNAAQLRQALQTMFPGVQVNADVNRQDSFGEHASGEALDIMVGNNRMLGEQINRWLLANADAFGLQYNLWRQAQWDPSGEVRPMTDRGSPTANHMDHVHARVSPGAADSGMYMPIGATPYQSGIQDVSVQNFGSSAQADLQGAVGAGLDQDFGISKGLPGIVENATKMLANMAFAPLIGALQAVAQAFGGGNAGSGLIGIGAGAMGFGGQGMSSAGQGFGAGFGSGLMSAVGPSAMGPAPLQPPGGWSADWNAIAQKESGGDWGINTGNGYSGGLQFAPSSWAAAGGMRYAPSAYQASPYQQALTAERLLQMQGPGAWPNTFTPGSAGPMPGMPGGGAPRGLPGVGMPQGFGFGMQPQGAPMGGPTSPTMGTGQQFKATEGGGFAGLGGLPMAAIQGAIGAAGGMGAGFGGQAAAAAAQTGIQLINRFAGWMGQAASIGVSGVMETLQIGDNPIGNIGNSWFGKMAGGLAGAGFAVPNMAGEQAPENPQAADMDKMKGLAQRGGDITQNIKVENHRASEDQNGRTIARHAAAMYPRPGKQ